MVGNIFEQFINTLTTELTHAPEWLWERQDDDDPDTELWIAWAAENDGKSAMICRTEEGYRVSLCVEYPLMSSMPDEYESAITVEMALSHETSRFASVDEAMRWVEEHGWKTLNRMAALCLQRGYQE